MSADSKAIVDRLRRDAVLENARRRVTRARLELDAAELTLELLELGDAAVSKSRRRRFASPTPPRSNGVGGLVGRKPEPVCKSCWGVGRGFEGDACPGCGRARDVWLFLRSVRSRPEDEPRVDFE